MARKPQMFTIYDKMARDGAFDGNSANADADPEVVRAQRAAGKPVWPVAYPKMLYHPQGEREVIANGEVIMTPLGPKEVGKQTALIHRIVRDEAEHKQALEEGWHETPGQAEAVAAGRTPEDEAMDLEAEIRKLQLRQSQIRERALKAPVKASSPVAKPRAQRVGIAPDSGEPEVA